MQPAANQLLERVTTRLTVDLHPSKLSSVYDGVHEHLNGLLLQCVRCFSNLQGATTSRPRPALALPTAHRLSLIPFFMQMVQIQ